ncbi:MAG: carbohydrate kinase [Phocaeicola sp.]|uniref:carbohydrate kinase family protein n=1 Tax=Phocaeicola sp. TaxID=2773926 RepID=UPI0023D38B4D|nr:carbohydrate kinase [Phocaeicola sp.]MDE5677509.1 carbohydrate kinase [Phocaeicola sp.]MDE6181198.1 carbohydrate kinase [Phocaeicola sp.]
MRKIIGIGETILDILFKDNQPTAAVPGGSVFNGIISLGRMGLDVTFISETGNDRVGKTILAFMKENGVSTDHVNVFPEGKSPVSLAFLDEHNDAEYLFYKDYPHLRLDVAMPEIRRDDIVMIGSYYAVTPQLRDKVKELLDYAHRQGAIIYYDVNFRSTHRHEAIKLLPAILENFEYADIVRGSVDDFQNMFGLTDADRIYRSKIEFYCPRFICTHGAGRIGLYTKQVKKHYEVEPLPAVSTVGAGDNFNAGLVFGLLKFRIRKDDLDDLSESDWDQVIRCGKDFSADVCMSLNNSISKEFAAAYK